MKLKIDYKGCVKSGNFGDDILFLILNKLLIHILEKEYNLKLIKQKNEENDSLESDIYVVGGGSIIHPLETSYTFPSINKEEKILFVNGTGMTDCNMLKHKDKINFFDKNIIEKLIFSHKNIEINFERIHFFYERKNLYGGFRGKLEKNIYNTYYKDDNIKYINDIGMLASILHNEDKIINSYERKIILINPIRISGIDALKDCELSYSDYNYFIDENLIDFSVYLVKNGFYIYVADFTDNLNKYYYDKIISKLDSVNKCFVGYMIPKNNIEEYLSVIKQSYIVIGTRLHTNIISNSFLVPSLNISYATKNINYAITNKLEDYFIPTYKKYLSLDALIEKFNNIICNYSKIQKLLKENYIFTYNNYTEELKKIFERFNIKNHKNFSIDSNIVSNISSNIILKFS